MTETTISRNRRIVHPESRRIFNPIQRDTVTFLETSEETDGEYSVSELAVAVGGEALPHRHCTYSERFRAIDGVLTVAVGGVINPIWRLLARVAGWTGAPRRVEERYR